MAPQWLPSHWEHQCRNSPWASNSLPLQMEQKKMHIILDAVGPYLYQRRRNTAKFWWAMANFWQARENWTNTLQRWRHRGVEIDRLFKGKTQDRWEWSWHIRGTIQRHDINQTKNKQIKAWDEADMSTIELQAATCCVDRLPALRPEGKIC